ncbi:MAG TPA: site-specific integrase [Polyangiaceae bacterium]|nr:site-specific integrase [Polyangiaceae bacterium]
MRTGKRARYRRDAAVQTAAAAQAEERRLLAQLGMHGHLPDAPGPAPAPAGSCPAPRGDNGGEGAAFTFADAVELFRETKAVVGLKRTSRRSYGALFDALLLPRFGALPAAAVDFARVSALDVDLVRGGLKPSTRANAQVALRSALRCAVDAGRLAAMPRLPTLPRAGSKVVTPPTPDEVDRALAATPPHARLALLLAADAGLRLGEVRGLRWRDVDLDAGVLVVRRTIYHGEVDTPKSGHERMVPLTPRLARALGEARAAGGGRRPEAPAAPSRLGRPWGETTLREAFRRALAKAGLPRSRLHDLRHAFVSRCFLAGADARTVQELAGHASLVVTQRYAHTTDAAKRRAIERMAAAP